MSDEMVVPVVIQIKPGTGFDPDIIVFNATKKNNTHFFFKKKGNKAWIDTILNAMDDGGMVKVNLVKSDVKTTGGKKYFRAKKVTK